jgi:hypothetical protein
MREDPEAEAEAERRRLAALAAASAGPVDMSPFPEKYKGLKRN